MTNSLTGKILAAVIAVIAVAAPAAVSAEMISRHTEILEYTVISQKALHKTVKQLCKTAEKSIWQGDMTPEQQRFALMWYIAAKMVWEISGAEHIEKLEYSSAELSGDAVNIQSFVKIAPNKPGLINELPARENRICPAQFFALLPRDTELAICADIKPEALLDAIGKCGRFREKLLTYIPPQFPMRELLQNAEGIWSLIILPDGFYAEIPDPEGKIFNLAKVMSSGKSEKSDKRTVTDFGVVAVHSGNFLVIYSSVELEGKICSLPKLAIAPEHQDIFRKHPEKVWAVGYSAPIEATETALKLNNIKFIFPNNGLPTVLSSSRSRSGFLFTCNSYNTLLGDNLETFLLMMEQFMNIKLPEKSPKTAAPAPPPQEEKKSLPENVIKSERKCSCRKLLEQHAANFSKSKAKHGFYRLQNDNFTLCKPQEYEVIYWGKKKCDRNGKALPEVTARPHDGSFCVRFSDGKVEHFTLSNPNRLTRIISFLMTRKKYEEADFLQLIKQAKDYDKELFPVK